MALAEDGSKFMSLMQGTRCPKPAHGMRIPEAPHMSEQGCSARRLERLLGSDWGGFRRWGWCQRSWISAPVIITISKNQVDKPYLSSYQFSTFRDLTKQVTSQQSQGRDWDSSEDMWYPCIQVSSWELLGVVVHEFLWERRNCLVRCWNLPCLPESNGFQPKETELHFGTAPIMGQE